MEDIDPKELTMSNIDKLELTRISDGKKVFLFDSNRINPIINQFLNSKKTEIYNPKISSTKYYCRIHFINKKSELIGFNEHPIDGRYFFYRISKYKNDSLFYILEEIDFSNSFFFSVDSLRLAKVETFAIVYFGHGPK